MHRAILHVDMDAFFASVEMRDRPELADRAVIVGGTPEGRGVVAAASYAARRFGVHSAMPTATALRLCPEAVLLAPRHDYYAEISQQIRAVFGRYTPLVEPLSLDEAFLDVTGSERLFGPAAEIGRRIKAEIRAELALVASVGVAPNKFLAKLASDVEKPDGFVVVEAQRVAAFLDPLPVTRLWGVGKVTARTLERLGIATIGQMRRYPPALLRRHLGNATDHLLALAAGRDERPVVADAEAKSISHETTFARDVGEEALLLAWLLDLTEQVAARLRRQGLRGRTVQIKVRYGDFTTITRARSLERPTDATAEIWALARELFLKRLPRRDPLRLIGVGVSGFDAEAEAQADLFADEGTRGRELDAVVDRIRARFGGAAVHRAAVDKR